MPLGSMIAGYIADLHEIGGLEEIDIANIAGVSEAMVSHWSKGTASPRARTRLVLSDLRYAVNRLRDYYSRDEVRAWLFTRHPQFGGERAIDLINQRKAKAVHEVIERLNSGAYL